MLTYHEAQNQLARGRNGRKKIDNNTYLEPRENDCIAVRLHETDIILLRPDNTYILDSGGWQTVTMKQRINEYSPARLSQSKGVWYVGDAEPYPNHNWKAFPYVDGMIVDSRGLPISPESLPETEKLEKRRAKLDRMIAKYIKGYLAAMQANGGPIQPDRGDCLGCQFRSVNGSHPANADDPMGVDHYLSHIKEKYYVGSLLLNALRERGYRDIRFIMAMIKSDIENNREPYYAKQALQAFFRKRKPALLELVK